MKILHTSDLHLASPLTTNLSGERLRIRKRELAEVFSRLCDAAHGEGCRAMIIAGDLFDSERVSKIALSALIDRIRTEKDIEFFYLAGNHEGRLITECGISLPKNLNIFGEDWTSFTLGELMISGRSRLTPNAFDSLSLDINRKNIVVLHGELRDHTDEEVIGKRDAVGRGIDYIALGHYHSYDEIVLDERTRAVYSGTPEGRGFDELDEKGYVVIDTDDVAISSRFVPFAKRTLRHIRLDISRADTQAELSALAGEALSGVAPSSLVRLELCGSYKEGLFKDTESIKSSFESHFFYLELRDSSRLEIDVEKLKYDKTLKGEFIRLVMKDESIDSKIKDKIISCGLYALLGEALFEE